MAYRLTITIAGRQVRHLLGPDANRIGSAPENDIVLADPTVSRRHARVVASVERVTLEDLGSRNGTRINGNPVNSPTELSAGDRLQFGDVAARLEEIAEGDLQAAVPASEQARTSSPAGRSAETMDGSPLGRLVTRSLIPLVRAARRGGDTSQIAVGVLSECFPDSEFTLHRGGPDGPIMGEGGQCSDGKRGIARNDSLCLVWRALPTLHRDIETAAHLVLEITSVQARPELVSANDPREPPPLPEPATRHPELRRIYAEAARVARGRIGVLIEGASGTGKELLATYIHHASGLPLDRLIVLNCAALPENLLEAELFGIEKGVATGVDARPGRFELADGGTLFLDEIGEMSPATQSKILRVLQEDTVCRVGGQHPRPAAVRIIAATNRRIEEMVDRGEFRRDLYHRIAGWSARLPNLAARHLDIVNLAAFFLAREMARRSLSFGGISRTAAELLRDYPWPGNVRELELEMSRVALFLEDGEMLDSSVLGERFRGGTESEPRTLEERLQQAEIRAIREALEASGGNVSEAARELDIGRSTLYRRMHQLGISNGE